MITTALKQPALAVIRFQFWKDALTSIWTGGTVPQHPAALMLAEMKKHRPVQKYYLNQMIDVRVSYALCPSSWCKLKRVHIF